MNRVQKVTAVTGFVLAMILSVVSLNALVNDASASVIIEPPGKNNIVVNYNNSNY